jgi:hypothetical protein
MKLNYKIATHDDLLAVSKFSGLSVGSYKESYFSELMKGSLLAIAKTGTEVVGVEGYVKYDLIINNQLCTSHRSENTLISPSLRGKGAFKLLVDICSENAKLINSQFCWGTTPLAKAFKGAKFEFYKGYRSYVMIPINPLKIFSPRFYLKGLLDGGVIKSLSLLRIKEINKSKELMAVLACILSPLCKKITEKNKKLLLNYSNKIINKNDIDDLHLRIENAKNMIFISHNESLFKWVKNRLDGDCFMVNCYSDGRLVSYAFVKVNKGSGVAEIIDFCYENFDFFESTLLEIKRQLKSTNVSAIFIALNTENDFHKKMLINLKRYTKTIFAGLGSWVVRPGSCEDDSVYRNLRKWYLTDLWCVW